MGTFNFNINSQAITEKAEQLKSDRYTAMAQIAAIDMGITEDEMPVYMDIFHDHMKRRFGAIESVYAAINGVILNPTLTTELIRNYQQSH